MKINLSRKEKFIFLGVGLLIFFLPLLFIQDLGPSSFKDTGQIGDTIGGITAPFLNFFGAILIYLALKAQIDANDKIQTQFKVQKTNEHFYKMLEIHLNNIDSFSINSFRLESTDDECGVYNGYSTTNFKSFKSAFNHYYVKLASLSGGLDNNPKVIFNKIKKKQIKLNNPKKILEEQIGKRAFLLMTKDFHFCHYTVINANKYFNCELTTDQCNELAYKIFFWGTYSNHIYGNIDKDKVDIIKKYLSLIRKTFRENKGAKYSFSYETHERQTSVSLRFVPFSGHSSRLAHYYRHLYQTVKFLYSSHEDKLITDLELDSNLKVLRAQFTNEEVLLLYYNYRIGFGANWDQRGEHNHRFFREYNLLHNIPLYDNIPKTIELPTDHFAVYIAEQKKNEKMREKKFKMFEWQRD